MHKKYYKCYFYNIFRLKGVISFNRLAVKEWFNNKFTFFWLFFLLSTALKSLVIARLSLRFSPYTKKK